MAGGQRQPPPPPPQPTYVLYREHQQALQDLAREYERKLGQTGASPELEMARNRIAELEQEVARLRRENDDLNAELDELEAEPNAPAAADKSKPKKGTDKSKP